MEKSLCAKPNCPNFRIGKYKYCKPHLKEIETKSELYLKEMEKDGDKQDI